MSADDGDLIDRWKRAAITAEAEADAAQAKLDRIAALFDDDAAHLGTVRGERVYSEADLRAILGSKP